MKNEYIYLFEENHNGFEITYKYFSCNKELNQKKVNELIKKETPMARRMGSSFEDLEKGLIKEGIEVKIINRNSINKIDGKLRNISGNY